MRSYHYSQIGRAVLPQFAVLSFEASQESPSPIIASLSSFPSPYKDQSSFDSLVKKIISFRGFIPSFFSFSLCSYAFDGVASFFSWWQRRRTNRVLVGRFSVLWLPSSYCPSGREEGKVAFCLFACSWFLSSSFARRRTEGGKTAWRVMRCRRNRMLGRRSEMFDGMVLFDSTLWCHWWFCVLPLDQVRMEACIGGEFSGGTINLGFDIIINYYLIYHLDILLLVPCSLLLLHHRPQSMLIVCFSVLFQHHSQFGHLLFNSCMWEFLYR